MLSFNIHIANMYVFAGTLWSFFVSDVLVVVHKVPISEVAGSNLFTWLFTLFGRTDGLQFKIAILYININELIGRKSPKSNNILA